jgi:hypothetical protein
VRVFLVRDEVQRARADRRERLTQVQYPEDVRVGQNHVWLGQVGMHHCYPVAGRQQRLAVQGDHEIVVDVDHVCFRRDGLRHLVHVGPGRKPAAQVEKLPDALIGGEVPDRARDERALILRDSRRCRGPR